MIAVLGKGLKEKDLGIEDLKQRVSSLEERVNDLYLIIKNKQQQQQQQRQQNHEAGLHKEIVQEI
jgi:UTP:GlnB (protein PII) uridylyltransferase